MNKHFNKKNLGNQESQTFDPKNEVEIDFPSAQEMLEKSQKNWSSLTSEQIFQEIQEKSQSGDRRVSFFNATISDEIANILRNKGYEIYISDLEGSPYFKVFW